MDFIQLYSVNDTLGSGTYRFQFSGQLGKLCTWRQRWMLGVLVEEMKLYLMDDLWLAHISYGPISKKIFIMTESWNGKTFHITKQLWCRALMFSLLLACISCWINSWVASNLKYLNSLWPSKAILWHRTWSTLVQVMAWCLMAPSHHRNQSWLLISEVLYCQHEGHFTGNAKDINH